MNTVFSNDAPAVPPTIHISVQFVVAPPIHLKIKNPMKTFPPENKPLIPSLFHIAASFDFVAPPAAPSAISLPLDNWTFSREKLEMALKARIAEIKKRSAASADSRAAQQPLLRIAQRPKKTGGKRPVRLHPAIGVLEAA